MKDEMKTDRSDSSFLPHRRAGCTLDELMVMLFAFGGLLLGAQLGWRLGGAYGSLGRMGVAIGGGLGGLVAGIFGGIGFVILGDALEKSRLRRQPFPPPCENGCCRHEADFAKFEIPPEVLQSRRGMRARGYRCRCGNSYGSGYEDRLENKFFRILPDGAIRPYLKHGIWGPWKPDDDVECRNADARCVTDAPAER
jgi:hypothetical protein